jgi:hypothetical protein
MTEQKMDELAVGRQVEPWLWVVGRLDDGFIPGTDKAARGRD